jgi:hypothetical protein
VIWLLVYLLGLAYLAGMATGESTKVYPIEVLTIIAWPVLIPVAFVVRWRKRRRMEWWNALTYEEREALNREGKGYWQ